MGLLAATSARSREFEIDNRGERLKGLTCNLWSTVDRKLLETADVPCHPPQIRDHDEQSADRTDIKKPRGGSWYTPGLLTRYAILGNRQFAGSEDTGSAYVLTTGAYTPEFPR
jgi:hypothetical protein